MLPTGQRRGASTSGQTKYEPVNVMSTVPAHVKALVALSTLLFVVSTATMVVNIYIASEVRQEYNDLDVHTTVPMVQRILTRVDDLLKDPERAESVFTLIRLLDVTLAKAESEDLIGVMTKFMKNMGGG